MNLLAHLHLGQGLSPGESAGNLTADFCREAGSPAFQRGVHFHRAIDAFTDTHADVAKARWIFTGELRRFGGVLSDLAFDLCLSRTWAEWAGARDRHGFIDDRLRAVLDAVEPIPAKALVVVERMVDERWLHQYWDSEGIRASIDRLAARRPVASKMIGAERIIERRYDDFVGLFRAFYPELLEHASTLLGRHNQNNTPRNGWPTRNAPTTAAGEPT